MAPPGLPPALPQVLPPSSPTGGLPGARGEQAPAVADCPAALAGKARCYTGQDGNGAHYALAVPARWNGSLVVHAHGGPDLGDASDPARSTEDLERWAVMVEEGYAWAGSSYRRGGYGTRMAAADTESVRRVFVDRIGKPDRTCVHGQSGVPAVPVRLPSAAPAGRARLARHDGDAGAGLEPDRRGGHRPQRPSAS